MPPSHLPTSCWKHGRCCLITRLPSSHVPRALSLCIPAMRNACLFRRYYCPIHSNSDTESCFALHLQRGALSTFRDHSHCGVPCLPFSSPSNREISSSCFSHDFSYKWALSPCWRTYRCVNGVVSLSVPLLFVKDCLILRASSGRKRMHI